MRPQRSPVTNTLSLPRLLLLLPLPALASEPAAAAAGGGYLQAFLALVVIIALLLGTAWLARKITGGKGFGQGGMKVIGGVALGPRERLVLVEIGDTWLVVGLVPGQIRTLYKMPRGDLSATMTGAEATAGNPAFAQWLKKATTQPNHDD